MLRRFINPILVFPICLFFNPSKTLLSETSNNIEEVIQEKENQIFLNYIEIDNIILRNNQEDRIYRQADYQNMLRAKTIVVLLLQQKLLNFQ